MPQPHLPPELPRPIRPDGVVALDVDLGEAAGHRLWLRSLERWPGWADLRFARVDEVGTRPLPRRVPPVAAWRITSSGVPLEVLDAVGRGDREFSSGEVRVSPAPVAGALLEVVVELLPGHEPLSGQVDLPEEASTPETDDG